MLCLKSFLEYEEEEATQIEEKGNVPGEEEEKTHNKGMCGKKIHLE